MLYLHDRYALDGDDPNTYTNILWCFGLHDRPWPERPIYGTIRSMVRSGMERKTDVGAYIREIEYLERTGQGVDRVNITITGASGLIGRRLLKNLERRRPYADGAQPPCRHQRPARSRGGRLGSDERPGAGGWRTQCQRGDPPGRRTGGAALERET